MSGLAGRLRRAKQRLKHVQTGGNVLVHYSVDEDDAAFAESRAKFDAENAEAIALPATTVYYLRETYV